MKSRPLLNPDGTESSADPGVELTVSKAAVEPVWYLPGVAERFGMSGFFFASFCFRQIDNWYAALNLCSEERSSKTPEGCTPSSSLARISRFSFHPSEI